MVGAGSSRPVSQFCYWRTPVSYDAANVLRYNVIEQLNLGEFQLSQSYLFFYDKLEKANYYLE